MALPDDKTPSPTTPAEPPKVAAPPEPAVKSEPPSGMVPKEKLDDALTRLRAYEDTLKALTPSSPPAQSHAAAGDPIAAIAQRLGTSPEEARQWATFLSPYLEQFATPYVNAIATLHDRYDALNAQTTLPDYRDYAGDIDKERAARASRNEYLSHSDAYHLVKSRALPSLLEKERTRLLNEQQAREQQTQQIGSDTPPTETAGPSPMKRPGMVSPDDFARMSLADKEAFLADKVF